MELEGKKINFLGDSITEGVGATDPEAMYVNIVKHDAELSEARNYGISGTRIARQSNDEGSAYCDRYKKMDDDADVVVVFGGTNDYGHGEAPIGLSTDRTGDTYYGACHELIRGLIEKYPSATIVVMTPIHRENEDAPSMGNGKPMQLYVDILREVCEKYSVPVLDLWASSGIVPDVPSNKEKLCPDGLHPCNEGNRIIASRLIGFLRAL